MKKYKLVRTSVAERQEGMRTRARKVKKLATKGIPDSFLNKSRETAADIIAAHHSGQA